MKRDACFLKFKWLFIIGVFSLVGCSEVPEQKIPYIAEFEQAKQDAKTDFERDVLADNKVTDAEYDEAFNFFSSCLAGHGYEFLLDPENSGGYRINVGIEPKDPTAAQEKAAIDEENINRCDEDTLGSIPWLYFAVRNNPDNENEFQWIADCLVRAEIRQQGYTAEQYFKDLESQEFAELPEVQACSENPKE